MAGPTQARARKPIAQHRWNGLPVARLLVVFVVWKILLLLIAVYSPGPGYDTSTDLLFRDATPSAARRLALTLTRWDAIYFTTAAHRGHVYEQEWAFSPFLATRTQQMARLINSVRGIDNPPSLLDVTITGVILSHVAHFSAVVSLYGIAVNILPMRSERSKRVAFTAACLHIFSPGGLFLSSVNGESIFAALSFAGVWIYTYAVSQDTPPQHKGVTFTRPALLLVASLPFSLAALARSNGLLNGIMLLVDLLSYTPRLPAMLQGRDGGGFKDSMCIGLAGVILGLTYAYGQVDPYFRHCTNGQSRPWCHAWPPSIYTFVQHHYWNNGFLRYWTLNNAPLFLLAIPMLVVMCLTAWIALFHTDELLHLVEPVTRDSNTGVRDSRFRHVIARLAIPQLVLALLITSNSHVQIINRISSGYPLWYILLALLLHVSSEEDTSPGNDMKGKHDGRPTLSWSIRALLGVKRTIPRRLAQTMSMYAIVQGGLYASFLPPA